MNAVTSSPRRPLVRRLAALGMAGLLLGASGCTAESPPAAENVQAVEASGSPGPPAIDEEQLRETFERLAEELLVPGAAMLLRTPERELEFTYGDRARDDSDPVDLQDHIRIGSVTKTWTGTIILQLVEEGRLSLDDPVSKFREDVPNGENITIEQLLNMRSGLYNYSESYELSLALDETPQRVWTPEELVGIALPLPAYFPPGEGYHYSNTNTVLLGLIAEELEDKPLEEIVQDRLLDPLGMDESAFPPSADTALQRPHPQGYMFMDNVLTIASTKLPADLIAAAESGELEPNDVTDANSSWTWAAGQGTSTAGDVAVWAEALAEGGVLGDETQQLRMDSLQPVDPDNPESPLYGLAIAKFGELYGHTGELPGFNTFMGHDPGNDLTLIVWTNLAPAADGRDPATSIARELIGEIYGR
ncbi:D-alanyl-D-alanine carboxypeptidase [Arthrobacter crystallopoietes BAB-32]|uniref:D-alanyl-D-alanine carboxypeptidase n=1 Tax=Arthrobacter crystallopoietes BAB-32 TaxID=1246476 RepID=N1V6R4_9MICC|nr:serine hydrolase domain-containing protein [Arthrobacter crystallopoietes]EMY35709.1 D-alanyl-D-alanine carboxypeptidase [Arthrobacter crystallopoietes BAB-32]